MAATSKKAVKKAPKSRKTADVPKDKLLSKITIFFFDRPLLTAALWIFLTLFGAFSYTTFLKREGFPEVNFPIAIVGGTYLVNDPAKVDAEVAGPITDIAMDQGIAISSISTRSGGNFFNVEIMYDSDVDAKEATSKIEQAVKDSGQLPKEAAVQYNVPHFGATGGDVFQLDLALSFYDESGTLDAAGLTEKAGTFAQELKAKNITDVKDVFVKPLFSQTQNPATGELVNVQRNFDRFGLREDNETNYYSSIIVGVAADEGFDVIKLDENVREATDEITSEPEFADAGLKVHVSASQAPQIEHNISELQRSLLEGLIAILIVGSIVIAIRASIITVVAMITVVSITLGFLYAIGYTLNVITLFALILALALIVDDTIIMVEAIDAARRRSRDRRKIVQEATSKISRAMVAATLTAALSFAPLLFVSGILGSFIRAIPITVIASLLISLLVALFFIPFFSRFLLLGPKQLGKKGVVEVAAGFEAKLAELITRPMVWARHSRRKLFGVGSAAVIIGAGFILAGLLIARNVKFDIFPATKDTDGLVLTIAFPAGTDLAKAEEITDQANKIAAEEIGENFVFGSYFGNATEQSATQQIEIISYNDREITSRQLVEKLQNKYDNELTGARVIVGQVDVSPPASSFVVQLAADDREAAIEAANDLKAWMETAELERPSGEPAHFTDVSASPENQFIRSNGQPVVTVSAGFDGNDTSTLVTLAETAVKDEFDSEKLAEYGLENDALNVDLGFESSNQESFKALVIAFPVLLVFIYVLLAFQFRSFLQPLLIFMAIPFSLFGIALGLDITSNAFSFFAMLGFFALLGLSIKNTILLTDYANQARRSGSGAVDSISGALRERFRPLFATSVTAVVSLIPLAISSPFWEGLMVVLIFGLVSSTLLVVTVFPYYYLGAEYLRMTINKAEFAVWLLATLALAVVVGWLFGISWGLLIVPLSIVTAALQGFYIRRLS